MSSLRTGVSMEKLNASVSEHAIHNRRDIGTDWKGLAYLTILVAACLTGYERFVHFVFPGLTSAQYQAVTVAVGTVAALVGSYYSTRKIRRALLLHAQAEEKLGLERNLMRTVTDTIPDTIFAKDAEGRYLLTNKAFAEIHGVKSPDELLGKTVFDLFPKERADVFHADDVRVMNSGGRVTESERTALDAEGNVKILHTIKVALINSNKDVIGVVGLHRDITRRRQAELKLVQSEANLAAAQRIAHFGSVELDLVSLVEPEKNPVRWSEEVFRIFGLQPGVDEPSRRTFFQSVHRGDKNRVREVLDSALREAKPYVVDFKIIRPDGTERSIHERGDFILDPKTHQPQKLVGSIQDVTERVQAEIRLQAANQELAERVLELQQRSNEINLLSELASRLQACKDAVEAYVEISSSAEKLFPKWSGALCVTRPSRTVVETVATWGQGNGGEQVFFPDDCWALRQGQPQSFVRDDKTVPCRHIHPEEVAKSLCVPLMAQGEALGVLSLQMTDKQQRQALTSLPSDEADHRLAMVLAKQVALALGNLKLRESLLNQSICDPLTGLFNRRYLEESLDREFSRANRQKSSVAVIMLDLDQFKRFNDTFGHQAGDTLLRAVGDLMKRSTRGQDIACRYGGEEFALVLTDSNLAGAQKRSEDFREGIKKLSVEYAGRVLGTVTVSMGIAIFPENGTNMTQLLRAADQALYRAKREGRDRVCVWTEEMVV